MSARSWIGRRARRRLLFAVLLTVAVDQVVQYTLLADGELAGHRVAPFDPPLFHSGQWSRLDDLRGGASRNTWFDPDLGWSTRAGSERGQYRYDRYGARVAGGPAELEEGAHRLALIGCSFTHGDEVSAEESWAAQLDAARDDWVVWNHGVGGYGLDQALLRLRRDVLPRAPDEVWLGWAPFTSLRATTQFPPLQNHWTELLSFKPAFTIDARGELRLSPNPARDLETAVRLVEDQRALLEAIGDVDLWIRRAPVAYAPRGSSWLHHSSFARLALTALERRGRGVPAWLCDPESEPARLVVALVRSAAAACDEAGVRFRLLVLPGPDDLATGAYWSVCVSRLEGSGVEVIDLFSVLRSVGAHEDRALWMPGGHYGPEAGKAVAEALAGALD